MTCGILDNDPWTERVLRRISDAELINAGIAPGDRLNVTLRARISGQDEEFEDSKVSQSFEGLHFRNARRPALPVARCFLIYILRPFRKQICLL